MILGGPSLGSLLALRQVPRDRFVEHLDLIYEKNVEVHRKLEGPASGSKFDSHDVALVAVIPVAWRVIEVVNVPIPLLPSRAGP